MANTIIQLKHSTVQGNVPVSLANGEISINTRDGKLFYSDPTGTIQEFSGFPGPSGLDTEIQFNDSGLLGANSRLTFNKSTGTLTVNGTVVANVFSDDGVDIYVHSERAYTHANAAFDKANTGGGGGGGTITVATDPPASGNANGDIWIDSNTGNEFIWFSDGNSYQWVELGPIGEKGDKGDTGDVSGPFNQANAAFIVANASFIQANAAFNAANNATDTYVRAHANAAFDQANAAFLAANNATDTYVRNHANSAFDQANAAYTRANNSLSANVGGTVTGNVTIVGDFAVTGNLIITGNTVTQNVTSLNITDPLIYLAANNYGSDVVDIGFAANYYNSGQKHTGLIRHAADDTYYLFHKYVPEPENNIIDISDPSFAVATLNANINSTSVISRGVDILTYAQGGFAKANNEAGVNLTQNTNIAAAFTAANSAGVYANGAFASANNEAGVNLTQNTNITNAQNIGTSAFYQANAAYNQANTNASNITSLQAVDVTQNTSISNLQGVDLTQNTNITTAQTKADNAFNQANAAFTVANSAFTSANGTIAWNTANAAFITANAAMTSANGIIAWNTANAAFIAANAATATDTTQNNSITAAFNQANGAFATANAAFTTANGTIAWNTANAAFLAANAAMTSANGNIAWNTANAAFTKANNEAGVNLTQNNSITAAFNTANAAFDKANTGGGNVTITLDSFTGTGSCTQFTLSVTPTNENYTIVSFDGAVQHKSTYSLSGAIVTFSEAPENATEIDILSFANLGTSAFLAYDEQFTGTGACTTFTLANTPNDENYTIVSIDGAVQHKSTYSLSGASIIFSEAPPNTSEIDVTYFKSSTLLDSALTVYAANHANAAFIAANNATDTYVRNHANSAFHQANAAFTTANAAFTSANGTIAWNTANAAFTKANADFTSANGVIAWNTANAAFLAANAATATDTTQNNSITAAFNQANTANNTAVAAFNQANSKNLVVVGRSTNTYIPIATGKITIEGRSANTLITIIS